MNRHSYNRRKKDIMKIKIKTNKKYTENDKNQSQVL